MPCALYNNNGYTCAGCCNFNKSTAIAVSGTALQITIPNQTFVNKQCVCVALCQNIPDTVTSDTTVQLSVNGTTIPLLTCCGNNVYADQLRCRKVLHITIATDTSTGIVSRNSCLCKTSHAFPTLQPATSSAS